MDEPLLSVASLHALRYCERLFYLEEVERIRIADAAVFAGRRLHVELDAAPADGDWERVTLESEALGLRGAVDVLRRHDGKFVPCEMKRGRSAGRKGARECWPTDRLQVGAYAMLVEDTRGVVVDEARVRYVADNVTVRLPVDDALRAEVRAAVARARELQTSIERPPVTTNDRLCARCSLAPVCLPEEARLAVDAERHCPRLLPAHPQGKTLHVLERGAMVGRDGDQVIIRTVDADPVKMPIAEIGQVVLHGLAQISTQALRLCADRDIGVQWVTWGGTLTGALAPTAAPAQRQLRQFRALSDDALCLSLARRLVQAKLQGQLRYLLRASREDTRTPTMDKALEEIRGVIRRSGSAGDAAALLGHEGTGAAAYFRVLPELVLHDDPRLRPKGRTRRPPEDRFNAALSYAYGMLYRQVLGAVVAVGLHPGIGIYHQPRSSAHPLALDVMELFRVPIVDMAIIAAINRRSFDPDADFAELPGRVLLTDAGRRRVIEVIERRLCDEWRHSVVGYSLSYARMIELEVRLLEKEWMAEGGLFARFRLR